MARIPVARTGLAGNQNVGPRQSGATAQLIESAGQSIARGIGDAAQAKLRMEQNEAAQYVAQTAPGVVTELDAIFREQAEQVDTQNLTTVDGFSTEYAERANERIRQAIEDAPPRAQERMKTALAGPLARMEQTALRYEAEKGIEFRIKGFERGAQTAANSLLSNPGLYGEHLSTQLDAIDSLDVPEQQKAMLRENATMTLTSAHVQGLIRDDPELALQALDEGAYDDRLGDNKAALVRAAEVGVGRLQSQAKAQQAILENTLRDQVKFSMRAYRDGVTPAEPPEQTLRSIVDNGLAGEMQDEVRDLRLMLAVGADAETFRSNGTMGDMERPEGTSVVRQMEATVDTLVARDRQARTPESELRVAIARSQLEQVRDRAENAPMLGMFEAGKMTAEEFQRVEQLDVSDPQAWQNLEVELEEARAYYGREVSPFSESRLDALQTYLDSQPPDAQAAHLTMMTAGMSDAMADAVARQMGGGDADPRMVMALALSSRGRTGVVEQILRGRSILQAETVSMPLQQAVDIAADSDYAEAFDQSLGAFNDYVLSAMAVYAANSTPAELAEDIDSERFEQALRSVAGSDVVSFNGKKTLPPADGMTQDEFDSLIDLLQPGDFVAHGRVKPPGGPFTDPGEGGLASAPGERTPAMTSRIEQINAALEDVEDPVLRRQMIRERTALQSVPAPQILEAELLRRYGTFTAAADGVYYINIGGERVTGRNGLPYAIDLKAFMETAQAEGREPEPVPTMITRERRGQ